MQHFVEQGDEKRVNSLKSMWNAYAGNFNNIAQKTLQNPYLYPIFTDKDNLDSIGAKIGAAKVGSQKNFSLFEAARNYLMNKFESDPQSAPMQVNPNPPPPVGYNDQDGGESPPVVLPKPTKGQSKSSYFWMLTNKPWNLSEDKAHAQVEKVFKPNGK